MKKLVAFFLAAVLVMGLTVTAFAAESPSVSSTTASATIDEADQAAVDELTGNASGALTGAGVSSSDASGLTLYGTYSLDSFDTATATVTISVPGLTTSNKVVVLQYVNGAWVKIDDSLVTVNDGSVTVIVDNDGPLAVYTDMTSSATTTTSSSTTSTTTATSPTTGEAPVMAGFAAIIAIAAAGMLISRKKHFA